MTESLQATESLDAAGATHPRVALPSIEERIVHEVYINAGTAAALDGVDAEGRNVVTPMDGSYTPLGLMTVCFLVIDNGFVEIGYSAPASPENFDAEKGRQFARENAVRSLWPKLGFALRERLSAS